jgi:thiosulfate/3-mercaptopyruvate sulfurtransferase
MTALITSKDLQDKISRNDGSLILLDATYGQPITYTIEGAQHFDIDVVADQANSLPHMIPTVNEFEHRVQNMGINHNSEIVIFDKSGFWMAAARVWWMFRLFGHSNVKVLDGGLQAWDVELAPYSPSTHAKGDFESNFQSHLYKSYDDIVSNDDSFTLVDARPTQAYDAGSISNSISIPISSLITPDAFLKTKEELAGILSPALSLSMPLATTCGSGITACALALSLYECGKQEVSVFDGSWIEWSSK